MVKVTICSGSLKIPVILEQVSSNPIQVSQMITNESGYLYVEVYSEPSREGAGPVAKLFMQASP
jgi:hypothetical protein